VLCVLFLHSNENQRPNWYRNRGSGEYCKVKKQKNSNKQNKTKTKQKQNKKATKHKTHNNT